MGHSQATSGTSTATTVGQLHEIMSNTPAIQLVRERFKYAERALTKKRLVWKEVRNAYHGYTDQTKINKGRTNIWFHKIFPIIELETARQMLHYMQHSPFVTVLPTSGANVESAKKHETAIQHYIEHCPTFFLAHLRKIKYNLMYGSGFTLPSWRSIQRTVKTTKPLVIHGMQFGEEETKELKTVYDGLFFKTYSPYEVFPYPLCNHITNCPWVITVDFVRADKLMADAKLGIYDLGAVEKIPMNSYLQNDWEIKKRQSELGGNTPANDNQMICLQTYMSEDRFITVANDYIVIKETANEDGYIPLNQGVKSLDPDSFWPTGTAKSVLPAQKMINLVTRAISDHTINSIWPVWKHKSNISAGALMSTPNHKIAVRQMDDVGILEMPELKHDLIAVKGMYEHNMNETHGFFNLQQGDNSGPVRTATTDVIVQGEGGIRIQGDAMIEEQLDLIPSAKHVSRLVQKFMPPEIEVRISGTGGNMNFETITNEDMQGEFTFKASGSTEAIARAVGQKQMIELFSLGQNATQYVTMADGQIIPVPVLDTYNALKDLYQDFNRADVDNLLYAPELFGTPINNQVLAEFNLPPIPGLDVNPRTGALSNTGTAGGLSGEGKGRNLSNNPVAINQQANRQISGPVV